VYLRFQSDVCRSFLASCAAWLKTNQGRILQKEEVYEDCRVDLQGLAMIPGLTLISCGESNSGEGASETVKLRGGGASLPAPIYSRWFKSYGAAHPRQSCVQSSPQGWQRTESLPAEGWYAFPRSSVGLLMRSGWNDLPGRGIARFRAGRNIALIQAGSPCIPQH
jgi:ABC-type phosphate transport system substrate-binding protein